MTRSRTAVLLSLYLCLAAGSLWAQPSLQSRVEGRVVSVDGEGLPGVRISFESEAVQGERVIRSADNGRFASMPLPPGDYEITFALDGFRSVLQRKRLIAGHLATLAVTLEVGTVEDEIDVVGEGVETVSESSTAAQTVQARDLEELAVQRNPGAAAFLSAGVTSSSGISISGGSPDANLRLLDGAVLNDNRDGRARELYIEDSIVSTTVYTGGVSAEFGRFSGGIINAVTRSGGDALRGSFRIGFDNPSWTSGGRFANEEPPDETFETYEGTLGGPVLRERLWYFLAARDRFEQEVLLMPYLGLPQDFSIDEQRFEIKLTGAATPSHSLGLTHLRREVTLDGVAHDFRAAPLIPDDGTLSTLDAPERLTSLNWTGVLGTNLYLEALYSERRFEAGGAGGSDTDLASGSPISDAARGVSYNASWGCAACPPRHLDNESFFAKGSYYLASGGAGSHELSFGVETFNDIIEFDDYVSATGFWIGTLVPSALGERSAYPRYAPGASGLFHSQVLEPSQGTEFRTNSLFVNDRWNVNDRWSLNLGLRYDQNDGVDSAGRKVTTAGELSPRFGLSYRPDAAGRWSVHATAGQYVSAIDNQTADMGSSAGNFTDFGFLYFGPPINLTESGPFLDPVEANQLLIDWVFGQCPDLETNPGGCPLLFDVFSPGFSTGVRPGLESPRANELTLGFHRALRGGGLRADVVYRDFEKHYRVRRDTTTGLVFDDFGNPFDRGVVENAGSELSQEYLGLHLIYNQLFFDARLRLGGSLTWSTLEGNVGHWPGQLLSEAGEYPEYKEARWNNPRGPLSNHHELAGRFWAIYDLLDAERHSLNASLMQSHFSGTSYEAVGIIQSAPFVENPGYVTPPFFVEYFFSRPGAFRDDSFDRTDLALNYYFDVGRYTLFFQGDLINVLNESFTFDDNTVHTALTDPTLQPFNPFVEQPVEGVHWRKGDEFGEPVDLGQSRSWRFSVGLRFNW